MSSLGGFTVNIGRVNYEMVWGEDCKTLILKKLDNKEHPFPEGHILNYDNNRDFLIKKK